MPCLHDIRRTANMADGYILRGGSKKINKDVQIPNFIVDCNQIDCRDITYDGERFKWTSGWEALRNFIEHNLKLKGRWTSPGGSSRKFTGKNFGFDNNLVSRKT